MKLRIITILIISIFNLQLQASACYQLVIEELSTVGIMDLYGIPGELELSLKVELKQFQESVLTYESKGLTSLESYDQAQLVSDVMVDLPLQLTGEHRFDISDLVSTGLQAADPEKLYLQISLVERSEVFGNCLTQKSCYYDLSSKSRDELKTARRALTRDLWAEMSGKWWTLPSDEIMGFLPSDEQAVIEKQILQLNQAEDLIPMHYLSQFSYPGQSELFWLMPHALHQHKWHVFGRIETCR